MLHLMASHSVKLLVMSTVRNNDTVSCQVVSLYTVIMFFVPAYQWLDICSLFLFHAFFPSYRICCFLLQVIYMTNFLEANHYKIAKCLAELDGSSKPSHMFAKYIEQNRDKQVSLHLGSLVWKYLYSAIKCCGNVVHFAWTTHGLLWLVSVSMWVFGGHIALASVSLEILNKRF